MQRMTKNDLSKIEKRLVNKRVLGQMLTLTDVMEFIKVEPRIIATIADKFELGKSRSIYAADIIQ